MKKDLENKLIAFVNKPGYQPVRFNIVAKKLGLKSSEYSSFKSLIKELVRQGRLELSKKNEIRPIEPHGAVTGIFRKTTGGFGFVRPHGTGELGLPPPAEIFIPEGFVHNAISGDEVLVRILKRPQRRKPGPSGEIVRVLTRATNQFVGTYFERDGLGLVRVDGTVFAHSVYVGDPGAKGARPNDKVVFEMLRFPSAGRSRRRGHHGDSWSAWPTRCRYAVRHPFARLARCSSPRTRWKKREWLQAGSAKRISADARI